MIALWLYRRLLLFYPSDLRNRYGCSMIEQFREEWADARRAGWRASAAFWLHLICDWAETVASSHAEIAGQDLRSAAGSLRRRPLSTTALVILLACVICINTVMLVVVQRLMFQTLPFEARGRLVYLAKGGPIDGLGWRSAPRPLVDQLARTTRNLEDVAYLTDFNTTLDGFPVRCYYLDPAAFRDFGLTAAAGRLFGDDDRGQAVIGWRLWQQRYRGLSTAIGSSLKIAGHEYRIVGTVDDRASPLDADICLPPPSSVIYGGMVARLKRGARLGDAQTEWTRVQSRAGGLPPGELAWLRNANRDPTIDFIIWLCQAAFLAALLLACADLASFQFGHILRRQREIALRMAVGASRRRLLRFLLTENLVTALLAGALSLPLSARLMWFLHARLDSIGVDRLWGWSLVRPDRFAILAAAVLSVASGILAGFVPAWRIVNRNPWPMLAPPRRNSRYSVSRLRLALLATQVALAALLVCFAAAFTLEGRGRLDTPAVRYFQAAWQVSFTWTGSRDGLRLIRQLSRKLEDSGYTTILTDTLPFVNAADPFEYEVGGRHVAGIAHVNARFFDTPGFYWRQGRAWSEAEELRFPPPVVVSQSLVQPAPHLGNSLEIVNPNGTRVTVRIAGVVDPPSLNPYEPRSAPIIFVPYPAGSLGPIRMLVRFVGNAESTRAAIQASVHEIDPGVELQFQDYGRRIHDKAIAWRYLAALLCVAGVLALGLALTGASAYLAQIFSERSQEVALRCAFGSRSGGIWIWVTRQVGPALAAAAAVAAVCAALLKRLPYGMVPANRWVLWAACAFAVTLVWGVWSAACWLASRKAAASPPMNRLRHI